MILFGRLLAPWMLYVAVAAAGAALLGSAVWYRGHLIDTGVKMESDRRDLIDAANTARANAKLAELNGKVDAAQATIDVLKDDLDKRGKELSNEKVISGNLQRDLIAGNQRMSVLTRQRPAAGVAPAASGPAAVVGDGPAVVADLDGGVAANLEWLRSTREEAITRLEACVTQYGAVKKASDSLNEPGAKDTQGNTPLPAQTGTY